MEGWHRGVFKWTFSVLHVYLPTSSLEGLPVFPGMWENLPLCIALTCYLEAQLESSSTATLIPTSLNNLVDAEDQSIRSALGLTLMVWTGAALAALPSSWIKLIAHMRLDSAAGRRLVAACLTSRLEALQEVFACQMRQPRLSEWAWGRLVWNTGFIQELRPAADEDQEVLRDCYIWYDKLASMVHGSDLFHAALLSIAAFCEGRLRCCSSSQCTFSTISVLLFSMYHLPKRASGCSNTVKLRWYFKPDPSPSVTTSWRLCSHFNPSGLSVSTW